ncbi:MAG: hypothetical protein ACJ76N_16950 [Thermoanaerobaculia bacterium]
MRAKPIRIALTLGLALLLGATSGCVTGRPERPKEPAGMKAVSPTPPAPGRPIAAVETFPNLEIVASQGDCAPRYANGSTGSCINSKPCRGYGMRSSAGAVECRCWAKAGGCGETERCDIILKRCVPDDKADNARSEVD